MIAITGVTGQLGTAFAVRLPDAIHLTRRDLDLSQPDNIGPTLADYNPSAIINCAAYTAVDRAEEEQDLAGAVNTVSVGELARYAAHAEIPLVTFSTDYVFDGTAREAYLESSRTNPISAYGISKLEGERRAVMEYPGSLVIRTSWLISGTHPNFVGTMLRLARKREKISVVADQVGCPTIVDDLAQAALVAMDCGAHGLLHLTNEGATTWFQLAKAAVELAGMDPGLITPCSTDEFPGAAERPAYSVLGSERRDGLGVPALPPWPDSLPATVATLTSG